MPPSKQESTEDVRRTLTPEGSRIALIENGFKVLLEDEIIAVVLWDRIQSIFAYTRYIHGYASLCLDFALPAGSGVKKDQVVVNDGVSGWNELVAHLPSVFPTMDNEWPRKAASDRSKSSPVAAVVPMFVANPTQVWPSP